VKPLLVSTLTVPDQRMVPGGNVTLVDFGAALWCEPFPDDADAGCVVVVTGGGLGGGPSTKTSVLAREL
jgi:hypothetical protein